MTIKQGFIIACLIGIVSCIYTECPPYGNPPGCRCIYGSGRVMMQCRGDKSGKTIEQFRNMLQDLKLQKKKMELTFITKKESKLTSRMFEGFNIKTLNFWFSHISKWADEEGGAAFVGLEDTLEKLDIHDSMYKHSRGDRKAVMTLGHLRKLSVVHFHDNQIYDFGNDWFGEGGSSVRQLELDQAKLYSIGDRAFASLTNLEKIRIYGNSFDSVARSMFPNPATHLRRFQIVNNDLSSLPEDIFTNMPSLEEVDLSSNRLTQLPESIWKPVWSKLRRVDFRENKLNCADDSLKWIFDERSPKYLNGHCYYPGNYTEVDLRDLIKEKQLEKN